MTIGETIMTIKYTRANDRKLFGKYPITLKEANRWRRQLEEYISGNSSCLITEPILDLLEDILTAHTAGDKLSDEVVEHIKDTIWSNERTEVLCLPDSLVEASRQFYAGDGVWLPGSIYYE